MPLGKPYRFRVRYDGQYCPDVLVWRWGLDEDATSSVGEEVGECAHEVTVDHVFERLLQRKVRVELYQGTGFVMAVECLWVPGTGGPCLNGVWEVK